MSSAIRKKSSEADRLDALFHALGDRTRRALLAKLAQGPALITQLAKPFAMSLPAVSRHIRVLEAAGLVTRAVDGRKHQCSLNAIALANIETWLDHYRRFWQGNLESLAQFVQETGEGEKARPKRGVV